MSNVIQLLESIGTDASLQDEAQFVQAIKQSGLSAELQESLLNKDKIALQQRLSICTTMTSFIMTPDEDEPEPDPDKKDIRYHLITENIN